MHIPVPKPRRCLCFAQPRGQHRTGRGCQRSFPARPRPAVFGFVAEPSGSQHRVSIREQSPTAAGQGAPCRGHAAASELVIPPGRTVSGHVLLTPAGENIGLGPSWDVPAQGGDADASRHLGLLK